MLKSIKKGPDFIGIGVMKAASDWIFMCLKEHPEICGSTTKEIHFFDKYYNYKKGLNYYLSFFNHCSDNKIKGEYTPAYIFSPKTPNRIYKHFPNVKIIVCLRNPIDRAYSQYRYNIYQKGRLSIYKSFEEALKNDLIFLERGFYYKQLKRYFNLYPKENILILIYKDLIENPIKFIQNIYKFLNLRDLEFIPTSLYKKRNMTGNWVVKNKIPFINILIYKILYSTGIFKKKKKRTKNQLLLIISTKLIKIIEKMLRSNKIIIKKQISDNYSIPPIKKETREYLINYIYKEDIKELEKLLNLSLDFWR